MIPVGTLCYIVRMPGCEDDVGKVATVVAHGTCDKRPDQWLCEEMYFKGKCYAVCQLDNAHESWCVDNWNEICPIAGPDTDVDTTRDLELTS